MEGLQVRDSELLRTLARLHYVSTRELVGSFFPSTDVARRRLRRLSELGLIRSQSRSVAESVTYQAWRLTPSGVEVVASCFPSEGGLDGLVERLTNGRLLVNLMHHETVGRLYFALLRAGETAPPREADRNAVDAYWRRLRGRAAALRWATDGTVMLRWQSVKGDLQLQPDATVSSETGGHRIFLEVDRSTHPSGKVRASLDRYRSFVRDGYSRMWSDGLKPIVLLVVKSEERRKNLLPLFDRPFIGATARVLLVEEAALALRKDLLAEDVPAPPERAPAAAAATATSPDARRPASDLYNAMRTYRAELRAKGADLPAAVLDALVRLRDALTKEDGHGKQA